jgi:hypothetical protein
MQTHCSKRFYVEPWLNQKRLRKNIRDSGDGVDGLPKGFTHYVEGGEVYFVANVGIRSGRMGKHDFLHLELGFALKLEKAASSVRLSAYTAFNGSGLDSHETYEDTNYFTKFPTEAAAFKKFAGCLRESKRMAVKITSGEKRRLIEQIAIPSTG